jgi:hypothetical protein
MDKKRPSWTFALEVMMAATQNLERTECHGTATGLRAVVVHEGQIYEILVNPLHEYAKVEEAVPA